MRRRLLAILALGAVLAAACTGSAVGYKAFIPLPHTPEITLNGGFKPVELPKHELAPIHFELEGTVAMPDGSQPPATKEILADLDKAVAVDAKGLISCGIRKILGPDAAPGACRPARIGNGELDFRVELPEDPPFVAKGRAVVYNGGAKRGLATIYVVARLPSPVASTVVVTGKVSKANVGPYGTKWAFTIPVVVGGAASLKGFRLEFFRRFAYRHEVRSYLLAKCPSGKLQAHAELIFDNGSVAAGVLARSCTPEV